MSEDYSNEQRWKLTKRLNSARLVRGSSIVGVNELIALSGSALMVVLVVISYLYFLVPARAQLQTAQAEKARLEGMLAGFRTEVKNEETTENTVQRITQSLERFETEQLFDRTQGRMDLYGELNQLITKNALRNTSGPTYSALDPIGTRNANGGTKSTNNRWQSVYPGIAISVTVEGQYANLRRFIHDIEASKLFVVVNAIELERATYTHSAVAAEGEGQPRNALVSLRLDMATYFQRSAEDDTNNSQAPTQ